MRPWTRRLFAGFSSIIATSAIHPPPSFGNMDSVRKLPTISLLAASAVIVVGVWIHPKIPSTQWFHSDTWTTFHSFAMQVQYPCRHTGTFRPPKIILCIWYVCLSYMSTNVSSIHDLVFRFGLWSKLNNNVGNIFQSLCKNLSLQLKNPADKRPKSAYSKSHKHRSDPNG